MAGNPSERRQPIVVSACLAGQACTYDGAANSTPGLGAVLEGFDVVTVCPEVLGGLGVPRPRCEVDATGTVRTEHGEDVTAEFAAGARAALEAAVATGARLAILKHKSPSCGCRGTYDGTHTRTWNPDGVGVAAALLAGNNIECITEHEAVARFGPDTAASDCTEDGT